jgi:hypothetical protein
MSVFPCSSSSCSAGISGVFIWTRFLWQVTRCELSLVPTHPDRMGGLGFLPKAMLVMAPLLAAYGMLLAGAIATWIFSEGARLLDFTMNSA